MGLKVAFPGASQTTHMPRTSPGAPVETPGHCTRIRQNQSQSLCSRLRGYALAFRENQYSGIWTIVRSAPASAGCEAQFRVTRLDNSWTALLTV